MFIWAFLFCSVCLRLESVVGSIMKEAVLLLLLAAFVSHLLLLLSLSVFAYSIRCCMLYSARYLYKKAVPLFLLN